MTSHPGALWFFALLCSSFLLSSCARPIAVATTTANAAAQMLKISHDELARSYRLEQIRAAGRGVVTGHPIADREDKKERVRQVRKRFEKTWEAYRAARAAWMTAASAIRIAEEVEKLGGRPDLSHLSRLLGDVITSTRELHEAGQALGLFQVQNGPPKGTK